MKHPNFYDTYTELLASLLDEGTREVNQRTGVGVRVGDPTSFVLDLSDDKLPMCGIRKTYPKTAAAEVAWFLQGRKDVSFIRKYAPIWDKFVEADGSTIEGAYGHRWRKHFGRDQVADAVTTLSCDPTDRRTVVMAWDPGQDGLGRPSKNVPCPVGFTLSVTGGKLNSTLLIRSSDVFVGLPYDVMGHALLMKAIQTSISIQNEAITGLGKMQVSLAHPHLYELHIDMAELALDCDGHSVEALTMPEWGTKRILTLPDGYVKRIEELSKEHSQPTYSCRPELVL